MAFMRSPWSQSHIYIWEHCGTNRMLVEPPTSLLQQVQLISWSVTNWKQDNKMIVYNPNPYKSNHFMTSEADSLMSYHKDGVEILMITLVSSPKQQLPINMQYSAVYLFVSWVQFYHFLHIVFLTFPLIFWQPCYP